MKTSPFPPQNVRRAAIYLLIAAATFHLVPAVSAATQPGPNFLVNSLADTNDGTCDAAGQGCTLREAINAANAYGNGAVITFTVSGTINISSQLPYLRRSMTIDGKDQAVVIDGNNSAPAFYVWDNTFTQEPEVLFNALTIARTQCAIQSYFGYPNVTNCTFDSNNAGGTPGGAIRITNVNGDVSIANSTFYNNSALYGGAISFGAGPSFHAVRVTNCTFFGSKATSSSAGSAFYSDAPGVIVLKNSIVAGGQGGNGNCTGVSADSFNRSVGSCSGATNVTAAALNLASAPASNGGPTKTIALLPGSVAINAGDNSIANAAPVYNLDQRGYDRVRAGDATCDVGAFEFASTGSLTVLTTSDNAGSNSLRAVLAYAQSLGGAQTIKFSPALAGQTVLLEKGWNDPSDTAALRVSGQITLQGLTSSPGVTIAMAPGVQKRHIFVESSGNLQVANLSFTGGNAPDYGGSIWSFGSLAVRGCTFTGNTAGVEGGAIQSWSDSPLLLIENSTFAGNQSNGIAGAIDTGASSMTFRYLTITNNTATNGNAVVIYKNQLTMVDSIIAGNGSEGVGSAAGGTFSAASTNNILSVPGAPGLTNGVNANRLGVPVSDVHLGLLADNGGPTKTIALQGGSVALDAGVDIVGVTTDQRGTARPQLNAPDIGAFELAPGAGSLVVTTTVDENNGTSDPNFGTGTSLREALIYAQSLGGAQTITFDPSLAGQTVTLTSAWNTADGYNSTSALRVDGNVTVQGPDSAPGIRLQVANASQLRHFLVGGSGTLVLKNVTVTGGKAMLSGADYGGAVWNFGNVTVRNCTFTGNTAAAEGGAIQSWGDSPSVSIENSSFVGNSSNGTGGALNLGASAMTLKHLTITNNTSPSNAVSLYKNSATMINTIIAGNSSDAVVGVNGGTFSPTSKNNLLATASAPGLTNGSNANQLGVSVTNLWLAPLALNGGPTPTVALQPGSIAIDAGVVIDGLTTDQRGTSRPQQDLPDVGAYELVWVQAAAPVINPPTYKHERAVLITITSPSPNTMIRYSVQFDSTMQDRLYTGPFYLSRTRTVYATAFGRGWLPNVNSANYAIDQPLAYWFNEIHPEGDYLGNMSGDGIVDLLKYAFNLAPQPGDLEKPNYRILAPNGSAGLPLITRDNQGRLVLEFIRRKASTNPGVTYIPETSTDLLTWSPLSLANATVMPLDQVWERVTVVDPVVSARRFGRVRVTPLGTYYNDFDRGFGPASEYGSAIAINGVAQLTDGVTPDQVGTVILSTDSIMVADSDLNETITGFTARFNLELGPPASGTPGDGLAFAVGQVENYDTSGFQPWGESGPGTGHSLAVGFDTYDNGGTGSKGIHVWVNGVHVAASPVDPYTNGVLVPVEITFEQNRFLTVKFNGALIFDHLPISGFAIEGSTESHDPEAFGFGARTSGAVQRALVDEVQIEPRF